jgi:shikimate dehydrogenase
MRLGLLGFPIQHSKSPELYKKLLGSELTSYDLFSYETSDAIPLLSEFKAKLDGLNITSPYKKHFFHQVEVLSPLVQSLGAINTVCFIKDRCFGANTDLLAVEEILINYIRLFKDINLIVLGDGVMATLTTLVAGNLNIPLQFFSRKSHPNLPELNLASYSRPGQTIIINACSRDFIFKGEVTGEEIFWDFNYDFNPHRSSLPQKLKSYVDGQQMLELQALGAIKFWREVRTKLK